MILWLSILGCAESELASQPPGGFLPPTGDPEQRLFLEVTPVAETEPNGSPRAFPAVVPDPAIGEEIVVALQRPFLLEGLVEGLEVGPTARATLPNQPGPIDAVVHLRTVSLAATQRASTDTDGFFQAPVIAAEYTVTIVPDQPTSPMSTFQVTLGSTTPDLLVDLDQGVPLYGRVMRGDNPIPGAPVQVSSIDGIDGPTSLTDADGWYEIRVAEGDYIVRSFGAGDGLDPVLNRPVTAGPQGHREDFLSQDTPANTLAARVLDPEGTPLRQVPYRLRSTALVHYDSNATAEITGFTDNNGNIFTRSVAGTYVLEVFAEPGSELSSRRIDAIELTGPLELGNIELHPFTSINGIVLDGTLTEVGGSSILCTELGFLGRRWSALTDEAGRWALAVPDTTVSCAAAPPVDRTDLALTRITLDENTNGETLTVNLLPGSPIQGQVTFEGEPEDFALVEVRDGAGRLWGSALTEADGRFVLRVAVP